MKLHLLSDIHLEFAPLDLPGGDVLMLAGDIFVADNFREYRTNRTAELHRKEVDEFFNQATSKYNKVVYIAGNHEHYRGNFQDTHNLIREHFQKKEWKIAFLDNSCFELNSEYVIFGSTFWTDFNGNDFGACQAAKTGMNDFRMISYENQNKKGSLSPFDTTEFNATARSALEMALEFYSGKKFIVMSHHLPDMLSVAAKYGSDPLNYAFANTGLKDFIKNHSQIKYWFHGHTHSSCDYLIGDCRVVCNPRGYAKSYRPDECENFSFNINHFVEI